MSRVPVGRSLALLASVALAANAVASTAPAQNDELLLRTYDVRSVLPRWDGSATWSQSLLAPPAIHPHSEQLSLEGTLEYGELAAAELHELLTQVLGDELRLREGREVMLEGKELTVMAPEYLQEQVRAVLEGMEMALSGSVPLRVDVLTLAEGAGELPAAGTLADAEAERLVSTLVAAGARHESHVLELSPGRTARSNAHRRVPFLFDYDVEIAQAAAIWSPVMADVIVGTRIAARGVPAGGGVALSALILRAELLGEIATRPMKLAGRLAKAEGGPTELLQGPDSIQTPEALMRGLAFDTFVPDGRAVVLTLEATLGAGRLREAIVLRRLGGALSGYVARPIPHTNRTFIAVDSELFRAPRMLVEASLEEGHGAPQPSLVATLEGERSGFMNEWLKRFSVWRHFGPWFVIVSDPAWDRDAAAQLDRLVKALRPAPALQDVTLELRAGGNARPVRVRLPLLAGSSAGVVLARGTTALTTYDVEVAQGASVPDPYVSSVFEGLALALSIDGTTCEVSGLAQLLDGPLQSLESGYESVGTIDRPAPRVLRFDERLVLPEGRSGPLRVGAASDRPDQPTLSLEISVAGAAR